MKAAAAEFEKWRERLRPFTCELLHGRIPAQEKQGIMERFRRGLTSVLISTTVIEVGVDVPNATVMLIENAERFGLAQLHQLRGRIGRGQHKSYCILLRSDPSPETAARLAVLEQTSDGFVVAEADWEQRGPGRSAWDRAERIIGLETGELAIGCKTDAAGTRGGDRDFSRRSAARESGKSTFPSFDCRRRGKNLFPRQLMKNLLKFFLLVLVLSAGVSLLYDYQLHHGRLNLSERKTPEKYTLAESSTVDSKTIASLASLSDERRKLVAGVIPSVVSVKTTKRIQRRQYGLDPFDFFRGNYRQFRGPADEALVQNSLGSGVIVTNEGHIITNNHVVDQVDEIEVQLSDGRTRKARLIGADAELDLAVLKMDEPGVKPLKLGDSDAMQAGDFVLAVGNPFGFEETVTDGIISSKGRPNRVDGFGDFLQTNAAINPGK